MAKPSIAVVPCSGAKLPVPCPARLLYSASGFFVTQFLAARAAYPRVVILSGKWGLVDPETVLAPYDQRIDPNNDAMRQQVEEQLSGFRVVSYGGADYNRILGRTKYEAATHGTFFQRLAQLGKHGSMKGPSFPTRASMLWLLNNDGATVAAYREFCHRTWAHPATAERQFARLLTSVFCHQDGDRIFYAFVRNPVAPPPWTR